MENEQHSFNRTPRGARIGLLVLIGAVAVLSVARSQQAPEIPPPVIIQEGNVPVESTPTPKPAASSTPESKIVPTPPEPGKTPTETAPPVIPSNPIIISPDAPPPEKQLEGQPTPVMPSVPPDQMPPAPLPNTIILDPELPNDSGFGPDISVPNAPVSYGRSQLPPRNLIDQTQGEADAKSAGCRQCHGAIEPMHQSKYVVLGCTDCHGGDARRGLNIAEAHVQPSNPEYWIKAANPVHSASLLNHEKPEFIRFINPGDLRAAEQSCGLCHGDMIKHVTNSMMNHGAMLWGAALYNNGSFPLKNYLFGQAYTPNGQPMALVNPIPVTQMMTQLKGILPTIIPLPRFNLSQPGNILRIFEKGQEAPLQLGIPTPNEPPGKPARRLSARGLGTLNRTDPVFLGLQKTRLNDPHLSFLGSNDHPGDYRSSGCTACHTVYANDRSRTNSDWYYQFGHQGRSFTKDPTISKLESGHPIKHRLTRAIPSSQCMICHMHQGNLFVNPYLGYTWWDQETDGKWMYPELQRDVTSEELVHSLQKNPEASAAKGLWGDLAFLEKVAELNPRLRDTQFSDYHGHGWVFRAVFKKDRKGHLLDKEDNRIATNDPKKWQKAVHLKDVHLERGMHCVDCHFLLDAHGDGTLYGEPRNATSIECMDCHGSTSARPTLMTSGNSGKVNLAETVTPFGPRFEWVKKMEKVKKADGTMEEVEFDRLIQHSNLDPDRQWTIPQTIDTVNPADPKFYNPKSSYAKTVQRDGRTWGEVPQDKGDRKAKLAHNQESMDCQICHSSWATSCFGCHLPMRANTRTALNKFEGTIDRNFTSYNPQVVRDDVFMLGIDGTVKKNEMSVIRSSSAVVVSSQNQNREWVYSQAQTVSWEGYSGQAFNPHFAHTTSSVGTTKNCTDCHLSKAGDNNAIMAQLLGFGTGTVNFFGRYAWVGGEAVHGVVWTEQEEPQAAIGSYLHSLAYPKDYEAHLRNNMELKTAYEHHAKKIQDLTLRGEFLYTANGTHGFEVYDVANIDNKGFSERIVTSPVSPFGQRMYVRTRNAVSLALPSTLALDPARLRLPENEEQPIPLFYAFVYGLDSEEGLVVIKVATLVDGNPENNFLYKDAVYNPLGLFTGGTHIITAGERAYITAPSGLHVVDLKDPMHPQLVGSYSGSFLRNPRAVAVQFQYAFVTDEEGLKVFDISNPARPVPVRNGVVHLAEANKLYLARTYAYVANGREGIAIIDIERPTAPHLTMMYNAEGRLVDTKALQIGSVNASMYALVADGDGGFKVVQLISPENVPEHMGFSPRPNPKLIAWYPMHEALAVSRGLERDRVVDETGHQTVVFGRRGSRPFNLVEMQPFLRHHRDVFSWNPKSQRYGDFYRVDDVFVRDGKLVTRNGAAVSDPVKFFDWTRPEPVRKPVTPGETPNPFLQPENVLDLMQDMDLQPSPPQPPPAVPTPTPNSGILPAQPGTPEAKPAEEANPFLQQEEIKRVEEDRKKSP